MELRLTDPSSWAGWLTNGRVGFECNHCDVDESGEQFLFPNQTRTYEFTVSSPGRAAACTPQVAAVWVLDTGNPRVDAVAWHVDWAQRNLDQPWGKPGTRYPLHRTFDETVIDANRAAASAGQRADL
ncbi:hypothetical protein OHB39_20295 [Streptomyces sp. NBC_00047]|uniref:hypothetical protein n=1 Tax=Streptomyces sp. NBC_00047 TaxID=2975627 RepID=UPI002252715A|nr:hypothetical protein [Streptomyces sp. NBC_00047]MCX5609905.1 hypothetical protein [Streptomyces sp. NBC_00047]